MRMENSEQNEVLFPNEEEIKSYLPNDVWNTMADYERKSYRNMLHNYNVMKSLDSERQAGGPLHSSTVDSHQQLDAVRQLRQTRDGTEPDGLPVQWPDVLPHCEAYPTLCRLPFVWYGKEYAEQLGISMESFRSKDTSHLRNLVFSCDKCNVTYTSPLYLEAHEKRCRGKRVVAIVEPSHVDSVKRLLG